MIDQKKFLNPKGYRLILASQSPRRKELLEQLGYEFEQRTKEIEENFPKDIPLTKVAQYLSEKKAAAYLSELKKGELLITSDTTVILGDRLLEKAKDSTEAKEMLQHLSGKKHQVVSGLCLTSIDKQKSLSVSTDVHFKTLSPMEIDYYIQQYKPFDKAGAYGIQEWIGFIGIEKIVGSYYNVMGLAVKALYEEIQQF